jgi:hypothetical protein
MGVCWLKTVNFVQFIIVDLEAENNVCQVIDPAKIRFIRKAFIKERGAETIEY